MIDKDVTTAPADEQGANSKIEDDSIKSTADSKPISEANQDLPKSIFGGVPNTSVTDKPVNSLGGPNTESCGVECLNMIIDQNDDRLVRVEIQTEADTSRVVDIPRELLSGKRGELLIPFLESKGLRRGTKQKIIDHIYSKESGLRRIKLFDQSGWHSYEGELFYITSEDVSYIADPLSLARTVSNISYEMATQSPMGRSPAEWDANVGKYLFGNPLLQAATYYALTASLLPFVPIAIAPIFNLVGQSRKGKSTALKLALSLYRKPSNNAFFTWNSTCNDMENKALENNNTVVVYDEMHFCCDHAGEIDKFVFAASSGLERGRCLKSGSSKKQKAYQCTILSSSEKSFEQIMNSAKKPVIEGSLSRIVDFDITWLRTDSVVQNLHGHENLTSLCAAIIGGVEQNFGGIAHAFVRELLSHPDVNYDQDKLIEFVNKYFNEARDSILVSYKGMDIDHILRERLTIPICQQAIGLMALDLRAITLGSIDKRKAREDILSSALAIRNSICEAWFERDSICESREEFIIDSFLTKLKANNGRFPIVKRNTSQSVVTLHDQIGVLTPSWGWRMLNHEDTTYFIIRDSFKSEFCKDVSARNLLLALENMKWLQRENWANKKRQKTLISRVSIDHARLCVYKIVIPMPEGETREVDEGEEAETGRCTNSISWKEKRQQQGLMN
ncbi:MAG: DUF927 domain-containing protein [Holosporales bacterium]|jgi:hypothetical protein|nr:DUF927 domain-containing protein [Holosporales bacterium]